MNTKQWGIVLLIIAIAGIFYWKGIREPQQIRKTCGGIASDAIVGMPYAQPETERVYDLNYKNCLDVHGLSR